MTRALLPVLILSLTLSPTTLAQSSPTKFSLPDDASRGLTLLYSGSPDAAIALFRRLQSRDPSHPLGFLLEADALWWKIWCDACRIQWGMIDAWERQPLPSDQLYFSIVDQAIALADARNKKSPSAEMHLYSSFGWALRARMAGLYKDPRATARAGVAARREALRAIQLDPHLSDAYAILGLYNYYVDTLTGFVRVLRFLMGIPGGSKKDGIAQLDRAIAHGSLTNVEARLLLALNLRNHDQQFERAAALVAPLVAEHPRNPLFRLILGDLYAKLSRHALARAEFSAAQSLAAQSPSPWSTSCLARINSVAADSLAKLPPPSAK